LVQRSAFMTTERPLPPITQATALQDHARLGLTEPTDAALDRLEVEAAVQAGLRRVGDRRADRDPFDGGS
jgi:hypothetical protein